MYFYKLLQPVLYIMGILLTALGVVMLIPASLDYVYGDLNWQAFMGGSFLTLVVGIGLVLGMHSHFTHLSIKQTFLLTTLSWLILACFGSLPLAFSDLDLSVTDALFESMSGLTTTGATIIVGLDEASLGILLWRALLHWYGGVGIIVMAIAILPMLRIGGMQLFQTESSDHSEKQFTQVREIALGIALTYFFLTVFSMVLFLVAGMSFFDALAHAMSAIATGGFSTHDRSFGFFAESKSILWITVFSMILASIPLTYYIRLYRSRIPSLYDLIDTQVLTLLGLLSLSIASVTIWRIVVHDVPWWDTLTHTAFNITSIATSTGFSSDDYGQWGTFPFILFFVLFFSGGCTGSTTGSIKLFRWQILFHALILQILRMYQPRRVLLLVYQGKEVDQTVVQSVTNFVIAVMFCLVIVSLVFGLMGLDLVTSVSAAAAAITNVGPGLGPLIGPAGTYTLLPDGAKWVMCGVMLMGRLEIFTVLILLTPVFWRE